MSPHVQGEQLRVLMGYPVLQDSVGDLHELDQAEQRRVVSESEGSVLIDGDYD